MLHRNVLVHLYESSNAGCRYCAAGLTVMAILQQVQPGAAHASALPKSGQSDLDREEDGPGSKPTKKHLWHNHGVATRWNQTLAAALSASSSFGSV